MNQKAIKQIVIVMLLSGVIVAGLAYFFERAYPDQTLLEPENALSELESLDGPFTAEELEVQNPEPSNVMNPRALLNTNKGVITLELFEDQMPITVGSFVSLSESGFYDGIKFHRVIDGFMIQGGDPNSKGTDESIYGTGGPGFTIQDEFVSGELLTNTRGTIAMANTGQPNSGGSQWFINLVDNTNLDFDKQPLSSKHPVFGRVIDGMDVVDTIGNIETKVRDIPIEPVVIESIVIEREG